MVRNKKIEFQFDSTFDFSEALGKPGITDSLVRYDGESQPKIVYIDKRIGGRTSFYDKYAGIHECICIGDHKKLALCTDALYKRCFEIGRMIISKIQATSQKLYYAKKRKEMHQCMLDLNLAEQFADSSRYAVEQFTALVEEPEEMLKEEGKIEG